MEWQCISPEVTVKGFKKRCTSSAVDGTDDDMLWKAVKKMGMLLVPSSRVRKIGMIGCPETSARNYHYPEEHGSHLLHS
jgi:hypothetical protein